MNPSDEPRSALEARVLALTEIVTRLESRTELVLSLLLAHPAFAARSARSEAANLEAGFKSRDIIQLIGCVLRVNCRAIGLSKRQAILVALLMRHALLGDSGFVSTPQLIEEIERDFPSWWSMPMAEDIHEAVYKIRKKLGLERDLLESSAAKGGGMRISTPLENIAPLKSPWSDTSITIPHE